MFKKIITLLIILNFFIGKSEVSYALRPVAFEKSGLTLDTKQSGGKQQDERQLNFSQEIASLIRQLKRATQQKQAEFEDRKVFEVGKII